MACMLLVPLIPILALVIQNVTQLKTTIAARNDLISVEQSVLASIDMAALVRALQEERSGAVLMMMTNLDDVGLEDVKKIGVRMEERSLLTDESLDQIKVWRQPKGEVMFESKLRFQIRLQDFRKKVRPDNNTQSLDIKTEDVMEFYNFATGVLLDDLSSLIKTSNGSSTWRPLITYKNLLRSIENIGTEMSLGLRFYGRGSLTAKNFVSFIEQHKLSQEYMQQSETFATDLKQDLDEVRITKQFQLYNTTFNTLSKKDNVTFLTQAELFKNIFPYFKETVNVMNQLRGITDRIREEIQAKIKDEVWSVDKDYALGILILTVLLFISPIIVMLIRNAVRALQILSVALLTKLRDLKREKKRSEKLIYQMLPKTVADSLKNKKSRSEMFDSATILFSEIDGFNDLARNCTPLELFDMLDIIYKTFDARIDRYDVHKVASSSSSIIHSLF